MSRRRQAGDEMTRKPAVQPGERLAYTLQRLVDETGLSESFYRGEMKAGRLPSCRAGRRRMVLLADWRAYVEAYWQKTA